MSRPNPVVRRVTFRESTNVYLESRVKHEIEKCFYVYSVENFFYYNSYSKFNRKR